MNGTIKATDIHSAVTLDNMIFAEFSGENWMRDKYQVVYAGFTPDEVFLQWFEERKSDIHSCHDAPPEELAVEEDVYRLASNCRNSSRWNPSLTMDELSRFQLNLQFGTAVCRVVLDAAERASCIKRFSTSCLVMKRDHLIRQVLFLWREKLSGVFDETRWHYVIEEIERFRVEEPYNSEGLVAYDKYYDGCLTKGHVDVFDLFWRYYMRRIAYRRDAYCTYWLAREPDLDDEGRLQYDVYMVDEVTGNVSSWSWIDGVFSVNQGIAMYYRITEMDGYDQITRQEAYRLMDSRDSCHDDYGHFDCVCRERPPFKAPQYPSLSI